MNERMAVLEHGLAALVASHADWLDGRTFVEACVRAAEGYFADAPAMVAVEDFAEALRAALAEDTAPAEPH